MVQYVLLTLERRYRLFTTWKWNSQNAFEYLFTPFHHKLNQRITKMPENSFAKMKFHTCYWMFVNENSSSVNEGQGVFVHLISSSILQQEPKLRSSVLPFLGGKLSLVLTFSPKNWLLEPLLVICLYLPLY